MTENIHKYLIILLTLKSGFFYKNHPGHGDQGWTNLSKLGPYTSIDGNENSSLSCSSVSR